MIIIKLIYYLFIVKFRLPAKPFIHKSSFNIDLIYAVLARLAIFITLQVSTTRLGKACVGTLVCYARYSQHTGGFLVYFNVASFKVKIGTRKVPLQSAKIHQVIIVIFCTATACTRKSA